MDLKVGKIITNKTFETLPPVNVFAKEIEHMQIKVDKEYENQHILFRKQFSIGQVEQTNIRITADDYYKLYINGVFVTQGPSPSYQFHYYYNEINITSYLIEGVNTIAVHTYYQGLINRVWVSGDLRHMMICEVESKGNVICATDETWKTKVHTGYTIFGKNYGYDTGFCESYNANAAEVGFQESDYNDDYWEAAVTKQNCYYKFKKQTTKQLDIYDIKPQSMEKNNNGYLIDVGREVVGYVTFQVEGTANQSIIIKSAEELNDDGTIRYKLRCNCDYREEFITKNDISTYIQYDYKAFRYLEIELPEGVELCEDSLAIVVRHYPFEEKVSCPSDKEDIQKIWRLCSDTIQYGMQEVLMDCPTREKGQYLGDGTISMIAYTILTQDTTFMKKTLLDFANTSFISQSLMSVSTASEMQEIADYSLQFPIQVLWLYNYEGDKEFLKEMYPYVKGICDDFAYYEREDGLLEGVTDKWNLVDWPANLRDNYDFELVKPIGEGVIAVLNAFYYGALVAYEQLSELLGISCEEKSKKVLKSFDKAFYNEKTGLYVDSETSEHSSIHANILPLFYNMREESKEKIVDYILERGITTCGVYMAMFLLVALRNHSTQENMEGQVTSPKAWLKMLSEGATTCYEAWGKEEKWNTSLFHPWATAPIIALTNTKMPF